MTREKDPAEIIETIAQSIRVSQRGARKVKAHRFKELFGYQVLNAPRRERIEQLMAEAGIEVQPSLEEAKRDDWLVMSMPVPVPVVETSPDPAPTAEWFAHMASVRTDTEREVEMHFASPLFREGLRIQRGPGGSRVQHPHGPAEASRGRIEADLLYFADDKHDVQGGRAAGAGGVQAADQGREGTAWRRSPRCAATPCGSSLPTTSSPTAGSVSVWDFQGAIAPDSEVLRVSQDELAGSFDDLYSRLNPRATAAARRAKGTRLEKPR